MSRTSDQYAELTSGGGGTLTFTEKVDCTGQITGSNWSNFYYTNINVTGTDISISNDLITDPYGNANVSTAACTINTTGNYRIHFSVFEFSTVTWGNIYLKRAGVFIQAWSSGTYTNQSYRRTNLSFIQDCQEGDILYFACFQGDNDAVTSRLKIDKLDIV